MYGIDGFIAEEEGDSSIGLGEDPLMVNGGRQRISLWMYLNDCDETIDVIRRSGAEVLAEPADQPWRERIARVADPDGNETIVGFSAS